jgi:myo-inositol-1(or 4)-monophosphatase
MNNNRSHKYEEVQNMTKKEIRKFLNEICDLVMNNLAEIIASRFDISIKSDNTPVTKSDLLIEELVSDCVRKHVPNVIFVGEESFKFGTEILGDYVAILDPIDGTENFSSGLKEWGVSFGIWKKQIHLGSFLLLPELGIRLLSGDEVKFIQHSRIIGLSSSISNSIINILHEPGEYRIMGCAVYNLYNVIHGNYKKFINPVGAYAWDILPGVMLALEHGCKVKINDKDYYGELLIPDTKYRVEILR